jgi:outer membrane protein OmpA-like peptidoglycan-associated protein
MLAVCSLAAWVVSSGCTQAPKAAQPAAVDRVVVVLLPDEAGRSGVVAVSTSGGTQEIDRPSTAVRVLAPGEAPSAPTAMSEADVQRLFGRALAALPAAPARFLLYFREGSDDLVPASRAALSDVMRVIRERRAVEVSVIGHTDTVADRDFNYRLGLRRAEKVGQLLRDVGVDPAIMELRSHGKDDLLVQTGDGVAEARNRRVEVTIR